MCKKEAKLDSIYCRTGQQRGAFNCSLSANTSDGELKHENFVFHPDWKQLTSQKAWSFYESVSIQHFMDDGKLLLLSDPNHHPFESCFLLFLLFDSNRVFIMFDRERKKVGRCCCRKPNKFFFRFVSKPLPSRYNDLS